LTFAKTNKGKRVCSDLQRLLICGLLNTAIKLVQKEIVFNQSSSIGIVVGETHHDNSMLKEFTCYKTLHMGWYFPAF
jgi:hypothetical protein